MHYNADTKRNERRWSNAMQVSWKTFCHGTRAIFKLCGRGFKLAQGAPRRPSVEIQIGSRGGRSIRTARYLALYQVLASQWKKGYPLELYGAPCS